MINDLWDGSMDKRKMCGLIPCCGQDGYRAHVPKHPIDSYNLSNILENYIFSMKVQCAPKNSGIYTKKIILSPIYNNCSCAWKVQQISD